MTVTVFWGETMGLKGFRLEFDHPARSYFASQAVTGKVILELRQEKKIQGNAKCNAVLNARVK